MTSADSPNLGESAPIDLAFPFTGRWLVQNSPANRIPSHGTHAYATTYAIDFVPVTTYGRSARFTIRSLLLPEPADRFPGFGRPILAPVSGVVVATHDDQPDHSSYRGFPSIRYALTQRQRSTAGWAALAGNHVIIDCDDIIVTLCHLQRGSIQVTPGQKVQVGDVVGGCGNSGNSTEPHVHIQATDHADPTRASAVPLTFNGSLPRNGELVDVG